MNKDKYQYITKAQYDRHINKLESILSKLRALILLSLLLNVILGGVAIHVYTHISNLYEITKDEQVSE